VHGGIRYSNLELRRRFGPDLGDRLHAAGREAFFEAERFILDEGFACDYRRCGTVALAWSEAHLRRLRAERDELTADGLGGRLLTDHELPEEVGTTYYPGGLVIEESGGLNPARYLAGLLAAAQAAGVQIRERTTAQHLSRGNGRQGRRLTVHTLAGSLEATDVIVATNGYTDGLVPWIRQRIIPVGSYITVTEPLDEALASELSPRDRMFYDSKHLLYYWRLTPDRRLLFGGRAAFAPTSVSRAAAILEQARQLVYPQTRRLRVEYAWGGNVGFTFDRLPHIGRHDGVHYALGCCGSGVAMLTYLGGLLARRVGAGTDLPLEASPFEQIPHPGGPGLPGLYEGRPWFLPIVDGWYRVRDWSTRNGVGPN
ncbi:MAG: NAD(P)/FAD-dependent oxidoreductase, partial [Candidatus Limnocylindrales bacterium]